MPWTVEQTDPNGEAWAAVLGTSEHLLFHTPRWANVLAGGVSPRVRCVVMLEDGTPKAGMLGTVIGGLGINVGYFSFPYGGIVGSPPPEPELTRLVRLAGKRLGLCQLQLVGYPHEPEASRASGDEIVPDQTNTLPLEGLTPESLLAGYKRVRRQEIKRALNRGVVIENRTDAAAIDAVYRFYLDTMSRTGGLARYKRSLIESIVRELSPTGEARLTIASYDDEPIAGMLVVDSPRMSHGLLLVSSSEHRKLEPNKLLLHTAAEQAIIAGKAMLDFMPSGSSAKGVSQFKALWHTDEVPLAHRTHIVAPFRAKMWRFAFSTAKREPFRSILHRLRGGQGGGKSPAPEPAKPNSSPKIIVLGNQKSGTTAIAKLLAERCGLSSTIDLPRNVRSEGFAMIRGEVTFRDFVSSHADLFSSELVKVPPLTFVADQIEAVFPAARLVGIIRDPRDNIRSLLNRRNLRGDRNRPPWYRDVVLRLSGSPRYDASLWGGETYIESLAHRWQRAADVISGLGDRCVLVRYEDFVKEKAASIDGLAATLGVQTKVDIGSRLDHQFQPRGDRGVSWAEFFGDENLKRIETICEDGMRRLCYAPAASEDPNS